MYWTYLVSLAFIIKCRHSSCRQSLAVKYRGWHNLCRWHWSHSLKSFVSRSLVLHLTLIKKPLILELTPKARNTIEKKFEIRKTITIRWNTKASKDWGYFLWWNTIMANNTITPFIFGINHFILILRFQPNSTILLQVLRSTGPLLLYNRMLESDFWFSTTVIADL